MISLAKDIPFFAMGDGPAARPDHTALNAEPRELVRTRYVLSARAEKESPYMHHIRHRMLFLPVFGLAVLPACSGGSPEAADAPANVVANSAATPPAVTVTNAVAPGPSAQAMTSKADGLEFSYKWPAEAAAIPELNAWLRANGEKIRADNQKQARSDQASAKKDGYPFNDHSYQEDYAVVADTPAMLVLLSDGYVYTGGAHGMPINTAIIWDKAGKKRLATAALIDMPRLAAAARTRFCEELDRQRAKKRGAPVTRADPNEIVDFVSCVDLTKQLVLPVSKGGEALDTIRIVIGPYEAGPYAEGSYVIDMPIDAALLATVKPAYKAAFATSG